MALPGHAQDCTACRYNALPNADRAALQLATLPRHTRREPPPAPVGSHIAPVLAAGAFVIAGLGAATNLVGVGVLGFILCAGAAAVMSQKGRHAWREQVADWKDEQTETWLQARAQARTWPCPTCGLLSCPNRHSVTTTSGVRIGRYYSSRSHTDGF